MLKLSKLNETIFGDMIKRSYKDEVRKEDEVIMKNFIESRSNPETYYIEDGKVCCEGNVIIRNTDLIDGHFPVKFGKVDGGFHCAYCRSLNSLEGAPEEVGGIFCCISCNSLNSLEGVPEKVGVGFSLINCDSLTSLDYLPEHMGGKLIISSNMKHLLTPEISEKYSVKIL